MYCMLNSVAVSCIIFGMVMIDISNAWTFKAYQNTGPDTTGMIYPESSYSSVNSKLNVGVSFSGGGDRSFLASIGYLGGLHELDLIRNVKYMVGVSGGSWATIVYSYYQDNTVSDETMLGEVIFPSDIIYDELSTVNAKCVRKYPSTDYKWVSGYTYDDNVDAIQYIYLDPSGLAKGKSFSYDSNSVSDIVSRNPQLSSSSFYKVRGTGSTSSSIDPRPYPIVATTLIGPYDFLPATPDNRNYTLLEFTPLTVGVVYTDTVKYTQEDDDDVVESIKVGGLVEPYVFGSSYAPATGLSSSSKSGSLTVSDSAVVCDLAMATSSSSYASGAYYAASSLESLQNNVGVFNYFSPSSSSPSSSFEGFATADGAGVQNTNIISLLQRNLQKVILFVNSPVPMYMSSDWDPASDPLSADYIDFTIPALFGHIAPDIGSINEDSYDLVGSQVFKYEEWVPLAQALQAKQSEGRGIVVSRRHTTVANKKYGIKAGIAVDVVWVYLGRSSVWENQLNQEMKDLVIPEDDPENLASLRKYGPFDKFPHYTTTVASINVERANLLADYTGWLIYEHTDEILSVMNNNAVISDSDDNGNRFFESAQGAGIMSVGALLVVGFVIVGVYRMKYHLNKNEKSLSSQDAQKEQELTEKNGNIV